MADFDVRESGTASDEHTMYEIRKYKIEKDRFGVEREMFASSEFWSREQLVEQKQKLLYEIAKIDEKIAEIDRIRQEQL